MAVGCSRWMDQTLASHTMRIGSASDAGRVGLGCPDPRAAWLASKSKPPTWLLGSEAQRPPCALVLRGRRRQRACMRVEGATLRRSSVERMIAVCSRAPPEPHWRPPEQRRASARRARDGHADDVGAAARRAFPAHHLASTP